MAWRQIGEVLDYVLGKYLETYAETCWTRY
jgi:hypothetical protein